MKNGAIEQKIRDRILSNAYGKFDLVENILTKDEILNCKPRIVLMNISERISLSEDKINRKTFWSWLRRYRQNNKPMNSTAGSKDQNNQKWLQNFKASVPKAGNQTPVIIKVIRSDNNSEKQ